MLLNGAKVDLSPVEGEDGQIRLSRLLQVGGRGSGGSSAMD